MRILNDPWLNMMADDYYEECVSDGYTPDEVKNYDNFSDVEKQCLAEAWDMDVDDLDYLMSVLAKKFGFKK